MEFDKHLINLAEATLHPPALWSSSEDNDDASSIPWVLLDLEAYVADCRNHTTALSHLEESDKDIQVTFFLARPPRVSYFCVFCPGKDHKEIPIEPKILAMDDDLVLLRIVVSPEKEIYRDCDLYIYQANGSDNGKPSLRRLPRPPGRWVFDYEYTGLLRCSYNDSGDRSILRSHGINKAEFIIAALCDASDPGVYAELPDDKHLDPGSDECYALYLYNSKDETWSVNLVSLDKQQQQKQPGGEDCFLHFNNKVITIGGEAGTMGFVDLYRGIILCDVLKGDPKKLRYAPLPPPMRPDNPLRGEPHLERDIAVMKGRIKFVEMEVKYDPNLVAWDGRYTNDGWMVWTWSRPVVSANSVAGANAVADDWIMECPILSSDDIEVENNPHFQLLPTPQDNTFRPLQLPPFRGLAVCHPALSLCDDDDTVCLMNKIFHGDKKAWVMAIDVGGKELRGVARFAADRTELVTFAYAHSRISKYLTGVSGGNTEGGPKHHRCTLTRSSTSSLQQFPQAGSV